MEDKGRSLSTRRPHEFEPFCEWQREDARDALLVHLPEFKKEQLNVQISSDGILKVSGERELDSSILSFFHKQVKVPKECNTNEIRAKFIKGTLYIILPKKTQPPQEPNQPPVKAQNQNENSQKTGGDKAEPSPFPLAASGGSGSRPIAKLAFIVASAMAAAALGAFTLYKYYSQPAPAEN